MTGTDDTAGPRAKPPVLDAVLGVVPSDPLDAYVAKGRGALLQDYYNPQGAFKRVYCLSPLESKARSAFGMEIIPTQPSELARRIRDCGIDVMRAYGGFWPSTYLCSAAGIEVPRIVSVHDTNPDLLHGDVITADRVFCVSNAVRALLLERGAAPSRLRSLPNRVDLSVFRAGASAPALFDDLRRRGARHIVLHVGRKAFQKNIETVIRAVATLGSEYWAVIAGPGDETEYRALAEAEGITRCTFLGSVDNASLAGYYAAADCVCMPSRWEGFGIVFIEALASGAAIVASDIAPLNEFMRNGQDALLVAALEDPRAVATAVRRACEDVSTSNTLRRRAPDAAKPFDKRAVDAVEVALYAEMLASAGRNGGRRRAPRLTAPGSRPCLAEPTASVREGQKGTPLVTVVMPTYNGARYMEQAVRSVLSQTLSDFEFLIVDDGSTDDTPAILSRVRDPRVRVIRQENRGLPGALNAGFREARARYLTWVSSDNYCAASFLEDLVGALAETPDALFAYSAFHWVSTDGQITGTAAWQDATYASLLCQNPGIASFMYRRECHEQIGWYSEDLVGAEDWDMWIRIRDLSEPVYVPAPLCYYRVHGESMTATRAVQIREACCATFARATARLGSTPAAALPRLYVDIASCRDPRAALFDAALDLGLRVLASPFGDPCFARDSLATALELYPESAMAKVAFAAAELANARPASACSLLATVRGAAPLVESAAQHLHQLAQSRECVTIPLALLPLRLRPRSELFEIEDRRRRARGFYLRGADPFADRASRDREGIGHVELAWLTRVACSGRALCIWGAGAAGDRARRLLRRLGIEPSFFIDSDPGKQGSRLAGVEVVSPSRLEGAGSPSSPVVVVASSARDAIAAALETTGRRQGSDFIVLSDGTLAGIAAEDGESLNSGAAREAPASEARTAHVL